MHRRIQDLNSVVSISRFLGLNPLYFNVMGSYLLFYYNFNSF